MENKKVEIIYCGMVSDAKVEGKNYTEFAINYLKELVNQYQKIKNINERLKAYIEYFVNNFSYDKGEYNRIIGEYATGSTETTEKSIEALFNFLYLGKGVCQQFSQALALTTMIDEDFIKNDIYVHYTTCEVKKDIEMGHAINLINSNGIIQFVDISSMVHAKEGMYKQDIWSFGLVSQEKYLENINAEGMDIVPIGKDENEVYMLKYKVLKDIKYYHLALNLDNKTLQENNNQLLHSLVDKYTVKFIEKEVTI